MQRPLTTTILVGLTWMLCAACVEPEPRINTCMHWCGELESCGLLPSSLGLDLQADIDAKENCSARCVASSESVFDQMQQCIDANSAPGKADEWCPSGHCSALASCVSDFFGDEARGVGSLKTEFCVADDPMIRFEKPGQTSFDACTNECASSGPGGPCECSPGGSSSSICDPIQVRFLGAANDEKFDADRVTIQLEGRETNLVVASGPCTEVLANTSVATQLPVGRYRGALVLTSEAEGTLDCVKVYSEFVVVSASETHTFSVLIPSGSGTVHVAACETSVDACSDGSDNDLDGLPDCADLDCAAQCVEVGPRCVDGIDNDGDGTTDCEDPDCAEWVDCTAALDGGTDTGGTDTGTGP